jgi:hypothetical protein
MSSRSCERMELHGRILYNRTSGKLKQKRNQNPRNLWIQSSNALKPLVTTDDFQRAQARIRSRSRNWTNEELLGGCVSCSGPLDSYPPALSMNLAINRKVKSTSGASEASVELTT